MTVDRATEGSRMQEHFGGRNLLTTTEVAQMLRVHPNTVRKWVTRGLLHAYRLGSRGDRRFAPEEVERFLRMNNGRKPPREGD